MDDHLITTQGSRMICKAAAVAFLVEFLKSSFVQISFTAYFQNGWRIAAQLTRHGTNGLDVLGDVIPDNTIAPSCRIF